MSEQQASGQPERIGRFQLTAKVDVPDFRDWQYEPALIQLKRSLAKPRSLVVLDQRSEGACTGFGLAAAINLLNKRRGSPVRVSPRMLYEMARKYDEWPGERYEGSSCRGAIKGWYNMGVCEERHWPYVQADPGTLTIKAAKEARKHTLGAYYRLRNRISDYHAALNEVGAIFCSAQVHAGWEHRYINKRTGVIPRRDDTKGGHAFAIVGYNAKGFWVQNSWGPGWGRSGTALWTYEDWQANVMDAWVFRLALPTPQIWHLPVTGSSDAGRGPAELRRSPARAEIAGHFVHIDDGEFHDNGRYWSNLADVEATAKLVADSNKYQHLLFYAHGGLNSPRDSARRIAAMKETFKKNGVYPFHFMYDTGIMEEVKDVVTGQRGPAQERAGGLFDWTDRLIEWGARVPGRALWREMKGGARAPFEPDGAGTQVLRAFLEALAKAGGEAMRIHLVGHSTGGILLAHWLRALERLAPAQRVASCSLLAPAATLKLFHSHYRPHLLSDPPACGIDRMAVYNLNDELERDDQVAAIYRKSLLYLVSNAFEEQKEAPLLGMEVFSLELEQQGLARLSFHYSAGPGSPQSGTVSETHGGFDNDPLTMNHLLQHMIGRPPDPEFTRDSLKY